MVFVIRTVGAPAAVSSAAQEEIHSLDPTQPISCIAPLETYIGLSVQGRGFALILIGAFAAIALALSMVGIYGVTAYNIGQRTREISIRLALGARPNKLLRLIRWQGMVLVICGVIVGVLASIALTRFLGSLLFKV